MRERFTTKYKGDILYASDVNKLNRVARRFATSGPGTNVNGNHTASLYSNNTQSPWTQFPVEIIERVVNSDFSASDNIWWVRQRFHYTGTTEWKTKSNENEKWKLDASDLDVDISVGDKINAYWHEQRGMFIPLIGGKGTSEEPPFADYNSVEADEVPHTEDRGSAINFALEMSDDEGNTWVIPNQRIWSLNGNVILFGDGFAEVSGVGFYSIRIRNEALLRVVYNTDIYYVISAVIDGTTLNAGLLTEEQAGEMTEDQAGTMTDAQNIPLIATIDAGTLTEDQAGRMTEYEAGTLLDTPLIPWNALFSQSDASVTVKSACIRIEMKDDEAISHTSISANNLSPYGQITDWELEAQISFNEEKNLNAESASPAALVFDAGTLTDEQAGTMTEDQAGEMLDSQSIPQIAMIQESGDGVIRVTTPEGEYWTLEIEVGVVFRIECGVSSSSCSINSSSSSLSSSSSSSSYSSSSSSTSKSDFSESSQSSTSSSSTSSSSISSTSSSSTSSSSVSSSSWSSDSSISSSSVSSSSSSSGCECDGHPSIIVDFGTGSLYNSGDPDCPKCDEVAGLYVLQLTDDCYWYYAELNVCPDGYGSFVDFTIEAYREESLGGIFDYEWTVEVQFAPGTPAQKHVIWYVLSDECNPENEITLSMTQDYGDYCSGGAQEQVTILGGA